MKQAHIDTLLYPKRKFFKAGIGIILNNVLLPVIKTSEITQTNRETGEVTKTTQLICAKCGNKFSTDEFNLHNVKCPHCENQDINFTPHAFHGITDDFSLCTETGIEVAEDTNASIGPNEIAFPVPIGSVQMGEYTVAPTKAMVLNKECIDEHTFFTLCSCETFLVINRETGEKKVQLRFSDDAIIISQNEIANIRSGKRSGSSINKTFGYWASYMARCAVSTQAVADDLNAHIMHLFAQTTNGCMKNTNLPEIFALQTVLLDRVVDEIRNNKPVSSASTQREANIKNIIASLPTPQEFTTDVKGVLYEVLEVDGIARREKINLTCPHCGNVSIGYKKNGHIAHHAEDIECEYCKQKISTEDLVDFHSIDRTITHIHVVQNYEDGIVIRDVVFRRHIRGQHIDYIPEMTNNISKTIVIIPTKAENKDLLSGVTILRYMPMRKQYSIARTLKHANDSSITIIHNEATNFNAHWSAVEHLNDNVQYSCYNKTVDTIAAYLIMYREYPVLEKLMKVGYVNIVCSIVEGYDWYAHRTPVNCDIRQNDIAKALLVNKACLRILNENPNKQIECLNNLQLLYSCDNQITADDYNFIATHSANVYKIADIAKHHGLSLHQICEYLERVRIAQCVPPCSSTAIWCDYLDAAKQIGCDLNDRRVKYPAALKTEHDKVIYKKKIIDDKEQEKAFENRTKEYGEKYSYVGSEYLITYPKTLHDLFEEGRILNHCVGTYGDSIKSGNSIILFVRKKECPNVPFFTIEVKPTYNAITQFYGHSDRAPHRIRDAKLIAFVKDWAKEHGIRY